MEYLDKVGLLDPNGKPFASRVSRALAGLLPRLRRHFPAIQDEAVQVQILEQVGHRISRRERQKGEIEEVHKYAWVAIKRVAISYLRSGAGRVLQQTLAPDKSRLVVPQLPSELASPEQMERSVLLRQVFDRLTPSERRVFMWKLAGKSSREIAEQRPGSANAVDVLYCRAVKRLRAELGGRRPASTDERTVPGRSESRVDEEASAPTRVKNVDVETPRAQRPANSTGTG